MTTTTELFLHITFIGIGATAVMDAWLLVQRRMGVPVLDFAMLGRWVGHLARGTLRHAGIARAPAVQGEVALGWMAHYAVGIAFAFVLVAVQGAQWMVQPALLPALTTGLATVAAPLFVMQPAMGAGIAASRTPTPLRNIVRSLVNHAVFGAGLYLAALAIAPVLR